MSEAVGELRRLPIMIATMTATLVYSLDMTIANVALPHIQASVSAGPDQVVWVLTSFIVTIAIMTPLAGWLAGRIGRKRLFLYSVAGFIVTSLLCGAATGLAELVLFRILQAACGASLIPLAQATMLDINPPEKHNQAMALWGAGTLLGPVLGPAIGGYLTENLSWRWCFFINLPVGVIALLGLWIFLPRDRPARTPPFDFLGFGMLALFVGCIQLVLDRGPSQDWFNSPEIWTEAILGSIAFWVFVVHTLTTKHPFFNLTLIRDRNFLTAAIVVFIVGHTIFATLALLPPMLQGVLNYPVLFSGVVTMPRGIGTFVALLVVSQVANKVDTRLIIFAGLVLSCIGLHMMLDFDLSMDSHLVVMSGLVQGFGVGLVFVPLTTLAFATLDPALRSQAAAFFNLIRSVGSSIGISVMQALLLANTQGMHGALIGTMSLSDPTFRSGLLAAWNPTVEAGAMALNAEVTRQASMVAYVDDFALMLVVSAACIPALLILRKPRVAARDKAAANPAE